MNVYRGRGGQGVCWHKRFRKKNKIRVIFMDVRDVLLSGNEPATEKWAYFRFYFRKSINKPTSPLSMLTSVLVSLCKWRKAN
jgi:hypothetical protein